MGGSCYRGENRELFYVGGWCENNCFQEYGGCEASAVGEITKTHETCEMKPEDPEPLRLQALEESNTAIDEATKNRKDIFLYVPDMFSDFYFEEFFLKLPPRDKDTYIAVNACIPTFLKNVGSNWELLTNRGVKEVWFGVESGNKDLRKSYNKLPFENSDVIRITDEGREAGVNVCWFLVDGDEDTDQSRLDTYALLKKAQPFRTHIGELKKY